MLVTLANSRLCCNIYVETASCLVCFDVIELFMSATFPLAYCTFLKSSVSVNDV